MYNIPRVMNLRVRSLTAGILAGLAFMTGPSALALPVDEPIVYPELAMEEDLLPAVTSTPQPTEAASERQAAAPLEMDENAIGQDEAAKDPEAATRVMKPQIGGLSGQNSMTISTVSNIRFETPYSEGVVDFTNPEGSTVNVQYLLTMSVADILRQTGRTGYTEEEYAALSRREGFSPESERVVVGQTKGIPPGKRVHTITLGALPDGSALGRGVYPATVVMAAFDPQTNQRAMVGAEASVTVEIAGDELALAFTGGKAELRVFTPADESAAVRYTLIITQKELLDKTGGYGAPGDYQEDAWVTLVDAGIAQPGEFLETELTLGPLPDGSSLPKGEYTAWLARAGQDADGAWTVRGADTKVLLTVGD